MTKFLDFLDEIEKLPITYYSNRKNLDKIRKTFINILKKLNEIKNNYAKMERDFIIQDTNISNSYRLLLLIIEKIFNLVEILDEIGVRAIPMHIFRIKQYVRSIHMNYSEFVYIHKMNKGLIDTRYRVFIIK